MLHDIELQAKALAPVLKSLVLQLVGEAKAEILGVVSEKHGELSDAITKRLDAIPVPDVEKIAKSAAALIEIPEPIPGIDGKSVTIEEMQTAIDEAAVKAVSALPVPKDGESVSLEAVESMVNAAVEKKVDAIPKPKDGEDGTSVSLEQTQAMINEAVTKAAEALPKPKDGESVSPEAVKAMLEALVNKAFSAISLPKDGNPGKDALEIDLLPRIDEEKSYPRGTWATHKGGTWRAHATTEGMRGWECVVDGVASFDIEQVDERNIIAVSKMASGKEIRKEFSLPHMIYRGFYREGQYTKGDVVTFGGCSWHCNADTDKKPGNDDPEWSLLVKKGRDGK